VTDASGEVIERNDYPGISPYAYCANDPVNFVDPEGEAIDVLWDVASIGLGVKSLMDNVKSGNVRGAIGDGAGIAVDALVAMVPFVPGGVGVARSGVKAADFLDDVVGAAKVTNGADSAKEFAKTTARSKSVRGGENAHTKLGKEMHKNDNPGEGYIKEYKEELQAKFPDKKWEWYLDVYDK
jgi:hypothetical protein